MADGKLTAEYKTMKSHTVHFVQLIGEHELPAFALALESKNLITAAAKSAALATTGLAPNMKVSQLVSDVLNKVSFTKKSFYDFLDVMEQYDEDFVQKVQLECGEYTSCIAHRYMYSRVCLYAL